MRPRTTGHARAKHNRTQPYKATHDQPRKSEARSHATSATHDQPRKSEAQSHATSATHDRPRKSAAQSHATARPVRQERSTIARNLIRPRMTGHAGAQHNRTQPRPPARCSIVLAALYKVKEKVLARTQQQRKPPTPHLSYAGANPIL